MNKAFHISFVTVAMLVASLCFRDVAPLEKPTSSDIQKTDDSEACLGEICAETKYNNEYFPTISKIVYEGPSSKNPFAFKYYNPTELILGKPMKEWLRFSLAFWHTMRNAGQDPFGDASRKWPWEYGDFDDITLAKRRLDVFFELLRKLDIQYWCFHDRDISPEKSSLEETNAAFDTIAAYAQRLQKENDVKLLWGTAQLFKHPRYMHGAMTSPNASVFSFAAAQVKQAIDVTHRLNGLGYVFWGGREGYSSLLNTDMKFETDNMARFLRMAVKYAKKIDFSGVFMIEPKPKEPSKHQYDYDAATTYAFLQEHGLENDFKLNIECNHATLSGHSCFHELVYASSHNILGSIDANSGDPQLGWDTDEFLTDAKEATLVQLALLKQGGLTQGGINFDAKLRRESIDPEDLFIAHISGMDAMARGLRNAAQLIEDGAFDALKEERYKDFKTSAIGKKIVKEKVGFDELSKHALKHADPIHDGLKSGKQELFEMIFNSFVH